MLKIFRFLTIILISQSLIFISFAHADQLALPSGDIVAPQITHDPMTDSIATGSNQKITAIVTDNVGIKAVTLFYRSEGSENYKRTQMNKAINSDQYSTTLGAEDTVGAGIEYYIQAVDTAGNALLHGHSFSPLKVAINPGTTPTESESAASESETNVAGSFDFLKNTNKWVWVGLGVVVVAALASGGGDDDPAPATGTVTFTDANTPQ